MYDCQRFSNFNPTNFHPVFLLYHSITYVDMCFAVLQLFSIAKTSCFFSVNIILNYFTCFWLLVLMTNLIVMKIFV